MKTLVIGLGNPILGDDGVGWQIASKLQQLEKFPSEVTIDCLAIGGFSLMEALMGYDRAILIDAIVTHQHPIGSVNHYKLEDITNPFCGHMSSAHDTSLQDALEIGFSLGAHLPKDISVVAVEAQKVYEFSNDLTPPVAAAVPEAVDIILDLLINPLQEKQRQKIFNITEEEHQ